MRRGDDAALEAQRLVPTDGMVRALLQHTQELHLERRRDVGDLVEKDRAVWARARERAFVGPHSTRERALPMPEELRLDEPLGERHEVEREETLGEALREPLGLRIEGDVSGEPDGRGGGFLAGAGLAEHERREVLHAPEEVLFVAADVVGEHGVPQRLAHGTHRGALTDQPKRDRRERAAHLPGELEHAMGLLGRDTRAHERTDEPPCERHSLRHAERSTLALDRTVEVRDVTVEDVKEEHVLEQHTVLAFVRTHIGHAVLADALEGFLDAGRCPLERLVRGRDAPGELAIDALARDRERVRVRGDRHALEERAV
jgi:hypothetical protein